MQIGTVQLASNVHSAAALAAYTVQRAAAPPGHPPGLTPAIKAPRFDPERVGSNSGLGKGGPRRPMACERSNGAGHPPHMASLL
jgi:hypothetical protein